MLQMKIGRPSCRLLHIHNLPHVMAAAFWSQCFKVVSPPARPGIFIRVYGSWIWFSCLELFNTTECHLPTYEGSFCCGKIGGDSRLKQDWEIFLFFFLEGSVWWSEKELRLNLGSPSSMLNSCQGWAFIHHGTIKFPWLHNHWQIHTGGVMRIVGITELMPLLRLSSFPFSRYASLYLLLSPDNRSLLSLPSELPSICFSSPCFLLLVPHLLTLVSHSLHHNPSLAFMSSVRTPFPGGCSQNQECFVPLLVSCADMTAAHPETVSAGPCCDTVCLTWKALLPETLLFFGIFEHSPLLLTLKKLPWTYVVF